MTFSETLYLNQLVMLFCVLFVLPVMIVASLGRIFRRNHFYYDENGNKHSGYYIDENGNKFLVKFEKSLVPYDEKIHGKLHILGDIKGVKEI